MTELDMSPATRPVRPSVLHRWLPIAIGAGVFIVALAFFGAIVGDTVARNMEMDRLITAIEASEDAMGEVQDNVEGVAAAYKDRLPLNEQDQADLDAALRAAASQGRDSIAAAGQGVADVNWMVWHPEIGRAQEAYLAHNRAWQAYMAKAADDPLELNRPQDDVNSTFMDAESVIRQAVPWIPMFALKDRVDVIFAPPPAPEGSGSSAQVSRQVRVRG